MRAFARQSPVGLIIRRVAHVTVTATRIPENWRDPRTNIVPLSRQFEN
jgi:hypothetical protein